MTSTLTGVILAGGQNRRMGGEPKGLITIAGEPMVARLVRRMSPVCNEIIVVANDPQLYRMHIPADVRIIPDRTALAGPLGGMEAACDSAQGSNMWIVGCDMPYVSDLAAMLMMQQLLQQDDLDAVLPVIGGKIHPLHGLYRSRVERTIAMLLREQQLRVMGLFEHIRWERMEEDAFQQAGIALDFVTNVNTPEEWRRIQALE